MAAKKKGTRGDRERLETEEGLFDYQEYERVPAPPDWEGMFRTVVPALETFAERGSWAEPEQRDTVLRVLFRFYRANVERPGLAKCAAP